MKQFIVSLLIILVAGLSVSHANAETSATVPDEVFVLAGQSNMVGRGQPLSLGETPDPRLLLWRSGAWKVASDPLGNPKDSESGIGPGMTFGLTLVNSDPSKKVGLVMCAVGATSITDWQPGKKLYKNCLKQVKAIKLPVSAVLFLQGESDAEKIKAAQKWEPRFTKLLKAFRHDMGGDFLLGQIGAIELRKYPYQQVVRDQQTQAAADFGLPLIVTSDLPVSSDDNVHFTVESYKTIGKRFANAWNDLNP